MTRPRLRFAPSPNGRLHAGHACSALLNERTAERLGGELWLRIEDIDVVRCTAELRQACLDDLAWLGLRFDGDVRLQSEHFDVYRSHVVRLEQAGLLYPCFCSRKEIIAVASERDPDDAPRYPGTCRGLSRAEQVFRMNTGEVFAWRLAMGEAIAASGPLTAFAFDPVTGIEGPMSLRPEDWGDAVIARKEIPTSYHLSVVVDDALQEMTHIVRGKDLEAATAIHVLLQRLLGLPTPRYHHHGLLTDPMGHKLAKSRGSRSLAEWRENGWTNADVRRMFEANFPV